MVNIGPLSEIKSWTQWIVYPIYGSDLPINTFTYSSVCRVKWAGGLVTLIPSQVSSSVSLHQLTLSKEIIFFVFAVPAVTKGLKRARYESTSDDDEWREGWKQLPDNNPWKLFGDYWRKKNVETMGDGLSITLAYDERGEKDPTYRLSLVPETNNKIIVRECYTSLYNYILELRRKKKYNGLVLTGQPGTGASSS